MLKQPIQAIVSFDEKGAMLPLYLKIDGEQLKIDSAILMNDTMGNKTFKCNVIDGAYMKSIYIVYQGQDTRWYLSDGNYM